MLGTLNGALEVRGISLSPDAISAVAHGSTELVDGVIKLTAIEVVYTLRVAASARDTVNRALERHQQKCPMSRSLEGAVKVTWRASIEEDSAA